jgi:hypothetical protein
MWVVTRHRCDVVVIQEMMDISIPYRLIGTPQALLMEGWTEAMLEERRDPYRTKSRSQHG